mgnify:CR=1 FL=1
MDMEDSKETVSEAQIEVAASANPVRNADTAQTVMMFP